MLRYEYLIQKTPSYIEIYIVVNAKKRKSESAAYASCNIVTDIHTQLWTLKKKKN